MNIAAGPQTEVFMKIYESKDLRNVALFGHGGSGKTILTEAMAFKTKLIDRMGKIEDLSLIHI